MIGYSKYRKNVLELLSNKVRENQIIGPGAWHGEIRDTFTHILPIKSKNSRSARIESIQHYLGVTIEDNFIPQKRPREKEPLHVYAHHLNSSQLLCYMAFRPFLTDSHNPTAEFVKLLSDCGINISENAYCEFEYSDGMMWGDKAEGTSFDFHISDGDSEYFFEIKFTEDGFGKAEDSDYHIRKINDIYLDKIKNISGNSEISADDCLEYYQLIRNVIRGDRESKTVVFITDACNPSTNKDWKQFKDKMLQHPSVKVIPLTWQAINKNWPDGIEKPFQFVCF